MKTQYNFIYFEKMSDDPEVWACNNNRIGSPLGYIEYYKPWKQMCFSAVSGAVFNNQCLEEITHFIGQLKSEK